MSLVDHDLNHRTLTVREVRFARAPDRQAVHIDEEKALPDGPRIRVVGICGDDVVRVTAPSVGALEVSVNVHCTSPGQGGEQGPPASQRAVFDGAPASPRSSSFTDPLLIGLPDPSEAFSVSDKPPAACLTSTRSPKRSGQGGIPNLAHALSFDGQVATLNPIIGSGGSPSPLQKPYTFHGWVGVRPLGEPRAHLRAPDASLKILEQKAE